MPFSDKPDGRPTSPQELLSEALYIANEIDNCVMVVRMKNKTNQTHWTNLDAITALGLLEYGKAAILDQYFEDEEKE
jgi:hypothetical protein